MSEVPFLHYAYRVEWSPEDGDWLARCVEFPSLSWLEPDPIAALDRLMDLVEDAVTDMIEKGEKPPQPLADKYYSGKTILRGTPRLHRELMIEAKDKGVFLNTLMVDKLSGQ